MKNRYFEISNKEGKIIRRGPIVGSKMHIGTEPEDYFYAIKDSDTGETIDHGRVYQEQKEIVSIKEPVAVSRQRASKLSLYAPAWKYGFNILRIFSKETSKEIQNHVFKSPEKEITLPEGEYEFLMEDASGKTVQEKVHVEVFRETPNDYLSILTNSPAKRALDLTAEKEEEIEDRINSILDKEDREEIQRLSDVLMGKRSIQSCSEGYYLDFEIESSLVLISGFAGKALIYRMIDEAWVYQTAVEFFPGESIIPGATGERYRVVLLEGGGLKFRGEITFTLMEQHREKLLEEKALLTDLNHKILAMDGALDSSSIPESWDRVSPLKYSLIDSPTVTTMDDTIDVIVEEWEFARRISDEIYLVLRPVGMIHSERNQISVKLHSSEISISKKKYGLAESGDITGWLETKEGRRITHPFISGADEVTENEKMRRRGLQLLFGKTEKYFKSRFLTTPSKVLDAYENILSTPEVGKNSFIEEMLKRIMDPKYLKEFHQYSETLMNSILESHPIDDKILTRNTILDREFDDLLFYAGRERYLLEIIEIPIEGESSRTYHLLEGGKTIPMKKACYYIASAISLSPESFMQRSGYVFANTLKGERINFAWRMGLEVREV